MSLSNSTIPQPDLYLGHEIPASLGSRLIRVLFGPKEVCLSLPLSLSIHSNDPSLTKSCTLNLVGQCMSKGMPVVFIDYQDFESPLLGESYKSSLATMATAGCPDHYKDHSHSIENPDYIIEKMIKNQLSGFITTEIKSNAVDELYYLIWTHKNIHRHLNYRNALGHSTRSAPLVIFLKNHIKTILAAEASGDPAAKDLSLAIQITLALSHSANTSVVFVDDPVKYFSASKEDTGGDPFLKDSLKDQSAFVPAALKQLDLHCALQLISNIDGQQEKYFSKPGGIGIRIKHGDMLLRSKHSPDSFTLIESLPPASLRLNPFFHPCPLLEKEIARSSPTPPSFASADGKVEFEPINLDSLSLAESTNGPAPSTEQPEEHSA